MISMYLHRAHYNCAPDLAEKKNVFILCQVVQEASIFTHEQ